MAISNNAVDTSNMHFASNGKANAALTLGIIGTSLAALNNGILGGNGLLNNNTNGDGVSPCAVSYREYASDQIALQQQIANNQLSVQQSLCDLAQRVAVNETANVYQNRISDIRFENVDTRFNTEQVINDLNLRLATCNVIKGEPMVTQLGSCVNLTQGLLNPVPTVPFAPVPYHHGHHRQHGHCSPPVIDNFNDCCNC